MPIHLKTAASQASRLPDPAVVETVTRIIADIDERGDVAVREYSARFDRWSPAEFRLDAEEIERIVASVDPRQC